MYTKGDYSTLPTNNDDLETDYTDDEDVNVSTRNKVGVGQTGTSQYMIHQFKNFLGSKTICEIEWEGKTTLAPVNSTVYLQVYNTDTDSWETVDSNSTWQKNINFELSKKILDTTDYKDASNVISCRVYQLATGTVQTFTSDYFEILTTFTYTDKYSHLATDYSDKYPEGYLLAENGTYLLLQTGYKILLELATIGEPTFVNKYTDLSTSYTSKYSLQSTVYTDKYPEGFLLKEDGAYLLLETGDKIILESTTVENAFYTRKYPPLEERSHSKVVTPDAY